MRVCVTAQDFAKASHRFVSLVCDFFWTDAHVLILKQRQITLIGSSLVRLWWNMLHWNVFKQPHSFSANTCKPRLANTHTHTPNIHLLGDRLLPWAETSHRPSKRNCHALTYKHTHIYRQQRPLLSLFYSLLNAGFVYFANLCWHLRVHHPHQFTAPAKGVWIIILHCIIWFPQVSLIRIHHTVLISSSPPVFTALIHCLHCLMEEILHYCRTQGKPCLSHPGLLLFQDTQMRASADK